MSNYDDFLKQTYYCDYKHPVFNWVIEKFKPVSYDKKQLAVSLFYFVRDYTFYRVGNWNKKASETFIDRGGTCTNNANLLVALCRAFEIPAGYGVLEVVGPEYFGPVILPHFARSVSKKSKHIFSYIYLGDKWVKCDPSDDEPLSISTQHLNPPSKIVEWNGIDHAVLNIDKKHIISESGPIANIDKMINKKQRISLFFPVKLANKYIDFLRADGAKIKDIGELEESFSIWLRADNLFYFILYKFLIVWPHRLVILYKGI